MFELGDGEFELQKFSIGRYCLYLRVFMSGYLIISFDRDKL